MKCSSGAGGCDVAWTCRCACPAQAQRPVWEQAGTLNCDVSGGIGFIIGSQREVNCLFTPNYPAPPEQYVGTITQGRSRHRRDRRGQLVWACAESTTRRRGVLAGSYAGASAEATVGAGLGANVLVGGNDRSVALQPLSVQGQVGTQHRGRHRRDRAAIRALTLASLTRGAATIVSPRHSLCCDQQPNPHARSLPVASLS